ncbi:MAG: SRPBCC domain-containing protein [Flavobacteriaceae bacterium]|nr:MAG: SRPBCC domain-containing protein [Flavobacteriaceae bacterium]
MSVLSFESFTKKIYIKAPIEELYLAWGTSGGICSWFLKNAVYHTQQGQQRKADEFIQAGDEYIWEWHNWNGQEKGEVLKANNRDYIEISFAGVSKVSIKLEQVKTAVLLTLKQYEIPTDEDSKLNIHHGCSNGWTFWLANLKAYMEYGILLNEKEFDLTDIPLAGFKFVNM